MRLAQRWVAAVRDVLAVAVVAAHVAAAPRALPVNAASPGLVSGGTHAGPVRPGNRDASGSTGTVVDNRRPVLAGARAAHLRRFPGAPAVIRGDLEHVSLAWAEGWACAPGNLSLNVTVEVYAQGCGTAGHKARCFEWNSTLVCLCGVAVASHPRESGVAEMCGGSVWRGFRVATPPEISDGVARSVFAFASVSGGGGSSSGGISGGTGRAARRTATPSAPVGLVPLGPPVEFDSDVLYSQERFGGGSVDFHLLVSSRLAASSDVKGGLPPDDAAFWSADHTLFVYWPPRSNATRITPIDGDFAASTGLTVPPPRAASQRHVGNAACYAADGTTRCNSVSVTPDAAGFVVDTRALGYYSGFVGMQHGWSTPPRPWAHGDGAIVGDGGGDALRVSATVTQPLVFRDDVTTSPDNVAYWYFVLHLVDRTLPAGRPRDLWFIQQAFQSRSVGLDTSVCTRCSSNATCAPAGGRCNATTGRCDYPCGSSSGGGDGGGGGGGGGGGRVSDRDALGRLGPGGAAWCPGVPDEACFQYRLLHPTEPLAWVDPVAATRYAQVPLAAGTPHLTLCGNGSYSDGGANGRRDANWTGPGTHAFCFEVSAAQLEAVVALANSAALRQDRGAVCAPEEGAAPCPAGRTCVAGECRVFQPLSLAAADYEMDFMLVNAEAVGPGHDAGGAINVARLGLSVQGYRAEVVPG